MIQYAAALMIATIYMYTGIMNNIVIGVSLLAIGTAVLLIGSNNEESNQGKLPNLFSRTVCWFGKNSYELYLFHIIILALMKEIIVPAQLGDYTKLLWMLVFLSTSAFVAGLIAKYFSNPINKKLRTYLLTPIWQNKITTTTQVEQVI